MKAKSKFSEYLDATDGCGLLEDRNYFSTNEIIQASNVLNVGCLSREISPAGNNISIFYNRRGRTERIVTRYGSLKIGLPDTPEQRQIAAIFPSLNVTFLPRKLWRDWIGAVYQSQQQWFKDAGTRVNVKPLTLKELQKNYHTADFDIPEEFNKFLVGFEIESYISTPENDALIVKNYLKANRKVKKVFCEKDGSLNSQYGFEFISQPMADKIDVNFFKRFTSPENINIRSGYGIHCHYSSKTIKPKRMTDLQKNLFGSVVMGIINEYSPIQRVEIFGRDYGGYCDYTSNALNTSHSYVAVWSRNSVELRLGRNTGDVAQNIAIAQNMLNVFIRAEKIYKQVYKTPIIELS